MQPRTKKALAISGGALATLVIAAIVAFVVWANATYPAAAAPLERALADPRISVTEQHGVVIMEPSAGSGESGIVFFAGAKVEPDAYVATFQETVAAGETVIVVQSFLNLPIFETRTFASFTSMAPDIETWSVGGHSMGGVKACGYAAAADEAAEPSSLILFASYCANDALATRGTLPVLSVSASNDGLATPEKIDASRASLPSATEYVEILGAVHAQFGAYGVQAGDGSPEISDEAAREEISVALEGFLAAEAS